MALKDLLLSSLPQYCEKMPSGKTICFRPMLVSEEKALMLAKSSGDRLNIIKTLESILLSCCTDLKKGDIKKLKLIDFEYLFLQLRAKSIGESEGFSIICPETKEQVNLRVNLLKDYQILEQPVSNKLKIAENIIIVMQEPTVEVLFKAPDYQENEESFYKFIANCLKQVQTVIEIKDCKDVSESELLDFVKTLTTAQLQKVLQYFDNIPRLEIIKTYTTSDQKQRTLSIKGLFNHINFFFEHISVDVFYKQQFQLKYYHNYSIEELDGMIPWERTVHVEQVKGQLEEQRKIHILENGG